MKSPTKKTKSVELTSGFEEVIKMLLSGKKVHSLAWGDRGFFLELQNGMLKLNKPDESVYDFYVSREDLEAEDYIIID